MAEKTITEALADLKTIAKRIQKQRDFVSQYLTRPETMKDPLFKEDGGSEGAISRALQSIRDLEQEAVNIRLAIADVNRKTSFAVGGMNRTIAEWLVWKREVAPLRQSFLAKVAKEIENRRAVAIRAGGSLKSANEEATPTDTVVNVNEADLHREIETLETILGDLDGQLSLKNATLTVSF